nr:MAG TPA: hypothetical protein [Caudoviricetes sp.]
MPHRILKFKSDFPNITPIPAHSLERLVLFPYRKRNNKTHHSKFITGGI